MLCCRVCGRWGRKLFSGWLVPWRGWLAKRRLFNSESLLDLCLLSLSRCVLSVMCGDVGRCGDGLFWRLLAELGELLRGLNPLSECLNILLIFSSDGSFGFAEIPCCPVFPKCMRLGSALLGRLVGSFCVAVV